MKRAGAIVWICAAQFFVMQAVVQMGWTTPFSLARNYISDLGNTACGPYPIGSGTYVCSPWHAWMNASFILQGLIIAVGAVLVRGVFPAGIARRAGIPMLFLGGLGNVGVGLFPENVDITSHTIGAALILVLGNLGMVPLGVALGQNHRRPVLSFLGVFSGAVGFLATCLFVSGRYLGLGIGGMERVSAYTLPLWLIAAGISFIRYAGPFGRSPA